MTTATTYHRIDIPRDKLILLSCDECGAVVPHSEDAKVKHQAWHAERDAKVVDLTRETLIKLVKAS